MAEWFVVEEVFFLEEASYYHRLTSVLLKENISRQKTVYSLILMSYCMCLFFYFKDDRNRLPLSLPLELHGLSAGFTDFYQSLCVLSVMAMISSENGKLLCFGSQRCLDIKKTKKYETLCSACLFK